MDNPWLKIPASDYEGHMNLPQIDQLSFLKIVFKKSLTQYDSSSVCYLGSATGNGIEHINKRETLHLTAIDINPDYLRILRKRYESKVPNLRTVVADLEDYQGNEQQYSLIFAGLVFEYLAPLPLLKKISRWLKKSGTLVVILQLKSNSQKKVSNTHYSSLKLLDPVFNLFSEKTFKQMAKKNGLYEIEGETIVLKSGKAFYVGSYKNKD